MLTAAAHTIADATGAMLVAGPGTTTALGATVDSRGVEPGMLFAALRGERTDGHDYVIDAIEAGARVVLISKDPAELGTLIETAEVHRCAVLRTGDVLAALQRLAAWHRARLLATVIAITGSTGKTSTKDFLTSVLSSALRVTSTKGNRNNELGLPLTILTADSETQALVLEMGMRGVGQIAALATVAKPDLGLVTNVGTSHIELLGSQDCIAEAKGELVEAIPADGAVFLNGDDIYSVRLATMTEAPVITYGLHESCDVRAIDIELDAESRASFILQTSAGSAPVTLGVPGRHNVYNACAAAAVGLHMGLVLDSVAEALGATRLSAMRMEVVSTAREITVLNDAYNANPSSMRAAIETLSSMSTATRRVAILGDMGELGSFSELAHFRLGEDVAHAALDALVTVGERSVRIADGARAAGMPSEVVRPCRTLDEASEVLDDLLEPGDVVLVKASRMMGLERLVEGIVNPRVG